MSKGSKGRRAFMRVAGWVLAVAAGCAAGGARAAEYTIAATPAWVHVAELPPNPVVPSEQVVDGAFHVLVDMQGRAVGADRAHYHRFAIKALNASGVESVANIQIEFDPSYQALALHSLDVIRDGHATSRLRDVQIRVLQRESGLEDRIYDGRKTASIFLEDVRVGDTVDYSYSVRGSNPVFGGRVFGTAGLQFNEPAGRIHGRLVFDRAHAPVVGTRNTALVPTVREIGDTREVEWSVDDVEPLIVENDAPDWYDPYPIVQWSAFDDWPAVVAWALPLYAQREPPGAALRAEVARIAQAHATPAARAMAALQFVQGEIRYLGVEIGANSHAPNPPDLVLKRRFGDCKDKAVLLVAMLHALHIQAAPALVNTRMDRAIEKRLPSPYAFNHVIARVRVDGTAYWLDPTRPRQDGAGLDQVYQPDFGRALVIDPATTGLVAMDNPSEAASRTKVHVVIDALEGFDKPVRYTVTTTSRGGRAEFARDRLHTRPREDMQKDALNFYARSFPGIDLAAPMESHNDPAENAITTVEHYALTGLANESADDGRVHTTLAFPDSEAMLVEPESTVRHAPLGRAYPLDATTVTEIQLPMKVAVKPRTTRVDDPAFSFERAIAVKDDTHIVFTDRYIAHTDHVDAADVGRFVAHLKEARESLGYALQWPGKQAPATGLAAIAVPMWLFALFVLVVAIVLARRLYRWDPAPLGHAPRDAPSGLGGWLLLPSLGLVVSVLFAAAVLRTAVAIDADGWKALTDPASATYHVLWAPALLFDIANGVLRGGFAILLIVLMARRRTSLPWLLPASLWLQVAMLLLQRMIFASLPIDAKELHGVETDAMRMCITALIWTAYFAKSGRVKATFVQRYRQTAAMAAKSSMPSAGEFQTGSD